MLKGQVFDRDVRTRGRFEVVVGIRPAGPGLDDRARGTDVDRVGAREDPVAHVVRPGGKIVRGIGRVVVTSFSGRGVVPRRDGDRSGRCGRGAVQ